MYYNSTKVLHRLLIEGLHVEREKILQCQCIPKENLSKKKVYVIYLTRLLTSDSQNQQMTMITQSVKIKIPADSMGSNSFLLILQFPPFFI